MVASVLRQLGLHPSLRELKLRGSHLSADANTAPIVALTFFLRSTASLEHLELDGFSFDKERMDCFVDGLDSNQSLSKLSFWEAEFDSKATDAFLRFLQKVDSMSSIGELCIGGWGHVFDIFEGHSSEKMVTSMLTVPDENQGTGSSIGSSLQVLEYNRDLQGICFALAANASRIRLPCLRCTAIENYRGFEALNRCLSKLVYLKELDIPRVYRNTINRSRDFVDAMRNNGSLQRVTVDYNNDEGFFDEAELRLIESCCKRNEAIPKLAAKLRLDTDDDDDNTDVALLPTIIKSAKQAARTAPNAILIALLAAGDSIGPCLQYGERSSLPLRIS